MSLLVGLTGGMGSGKSLAASYFRELGAQMIDADRISRELVAPEKPAWKEVVEEFGSSVLNPDQTLNRKQVAAIVFNDESKGKNLKILSIPGSSWKNADCTRGTGRKIHVCLLSSMRPY